ncbi:MAG: malonyl CoA-acyl carrier protein transacylase, partial [Croceicoccus sp.]|nr:malonyl CoA-acyl carrier protein transacylase [Croceicoccus sp.]
LGGKVLAPMIKRSTTDTDVVSVVTMEDCEALAKTL